MSGWEDSNFRSRMTADLQSALVAAGEHPEKEREFDGHRTRIYQCHKLALYQLSYKLHVGCCQRRIRTTTSRSKFCCATFTPFGNVSCHKRTRARALLALQCKEPLQTASEAGVLTNYTMRQCYDVGPRGFEPRSQDFQSCAYTKSAKVPELAEAEGFEPSEPLGSAR